MRDKNYDMPNNFVRSTKVTPGAREIFPKDWIYADIRYLREYLHFSPSQELENTFRTKIITYVCDKKKRDQETRQRKTEAEIHHRRNNDTDHHLILRHDFRQLLLRTMRESRTAHRKRAALLFSTLLPVM